MRVTARAMLLLLAVTMVLAEGGEGRVAGQEPPAPAASVPEEEFVRGRAVEILSQGDPVAEGYSETVQLVRVQLLTGAERGRTVEAEFGMPSTPETGQGVRVGETLVIARALEEGSVNYYVVDRYRLPPMFLILALFLTLAVAFARLKGLTSTIGLAISILVLAKFVVPQILAGRNPLAVSLIAAVVMALVSIYLAHGISRRTTVALVSTLATLALSALLAILFVSLTRLFGSGSEEAIYLQLAPLGDLNLRGLLLGGIILGALGVLDDITTGQAAAVDEIGRADPSLPPRELVARGLSVGREHIAALVNTLVLAYAGASLPLFLLFSLGQDQPLWVTLNSEFIAEEVIRTLVGSVALILAVPITTTLAAYTLRHRGVERGTDA